MAVPPSALVGWVLCLACRGRTVFQFVRSLLGNSFEASRSKQDASRLPHNRRMIPEGGRAGSGLPKPPFGGGWGRQVGTFRRSVGWSLAGSRHYSRAVAACVNGSGGCWSFSSTRVFSTQVRHSFAPVSRDHGEHLAAHLLVTESAPLTVHSTRVLAGGVAFGSRTRLRRAGGPTRQRGCRLLHSFLI